MRLVLLAVLPGTLLLAACGANTSPPAPTGSSGQTPLSVVAAENFYGDIAGQIGGSHVKVTSVLSDPNVDPHTYESNVDSAKSVASARLAIMNGAGYDEFMNKLLASAQNKARVVIDVSQLVGAPDGANPHLWYDPKTMPKVAEALADRLAQLDPSDRPDFDAALQRFNSSLTPLTERIKAIKSRDAGAKVLPTEPVFDYMAEALGLDVVDRDGAFQKAVEEGNDPPAQAVAQFRQQIASKTIKALIYNSQTITPITTDMQNIARRNGVSVVGVSETEPPGKTYQQWMNDQLTDLQKALG